MGFVLGWLGARMRRSVYWFVLVWYVMSHVRNILQVGLNCSLAAFILQHAEDTDPALSHKCRIKDMDKGSPSALSMFTQIAASPWTALHLHQNSQGPKDRLHLCIIVVASVPALTLSHTPVVGR